MYGRSNGDIGQRLADGRYWTSTSNSNQDGYDLYTYAIYVAPQTTNYRGIGLAIRCVVREG